MLAETLRKPESATPQELKLLSSMFGRKMEAAKAEEAAAKSRILGWLF